jgi:hypothetical protein
LVIVASLLRDIGIADFAGLVLQSYRIQFIAS